MSTETRFARGDHAELAQHVLRLLGEPLTYDAEEFHVYVPKRGIWQPIPSHVVQHSAANFAGCPVGFGDKERPLKVNINDARGAEALARNAILCRSNRITFDGAPPGIVFGNGFVTVQGGRVTLLPHAPENRARHGFEFDFRPWAPRQTPLMNKFLDDLFGDCSEDERATRIALLQEFAGACLIGDAVSFQQCLFLYGEGANGKSAAMTMIRAMFPTEALASIAPQRWSERFALAGLEGKRANFVSETPTGEILGGDLFKAVVTGDLVTAERKHRDPFEFRPIAGHIFSTNWPITTSDHSEGFWRRPIVLPFSRRFDRDPARRINPEAEVIEKELHGLIAWAIEGAARAQRQQGYTIPEQSALLLQEWRDGSDHVRLFLASRPADEVIPAAEFYRQYQTWARDNGHKNLVTNHTFGRRVMASGLYDRADSYRGRSYTRRTQRAPTP